MDKMKKEVEDIINILEGVPVKQAVEVLLEVAKHYDLKIVDIDS